VLTGTVTLPTPGIEGADNPPSFELTKQHVGKFTNSVEYSGEVVIGENQRHELTVSLEGTYDSGRLELKRDDIGAGSSAAAARPLISALLSGRWKGSSQSSSDTTMWTRLTLTFAPPPLDPEPSSSSSSDGRDSSATRMEFERTVLLRLQGSGVSNWRNQEVPFVLSGTLDLRNLSLELEKTHTGQVRKLSPNELSYVRCLTHAPLNLIPLFLLLFFQNMFGSYDFIICFDALPLCCHSSPTRCATLVACTSTKAPACRSLESMRRAH